MRTSCSWLNSCRARAQAGEGAESRSMRQSACARSCRPRAMPATFTLSAPSSSSTSLMAPGRSSFTKVSSVPPEGRKAGKLLYPSSCTRCGSCPKTEPVSTWVSPFSSVSTAETRLVYGLPSMGRASEIEDRSPSCSASRGALISEGAAGTPSILDSMPLRMTARSSLRAEAAPSATPCSPQACTSNPTTARPAPPNFCTASLPSISPSATKGPARGLLAMSM
mmetsp:Transcript_33586/g.58032  ORF Transcript_33586/g.58032 Transcript_33586/m.58032 type:complete len:223 (-) Transcript_33586:777-1445(-)